MRIIDKLGYAKQAVSNIARHDDALTEERLAALAKLQQHIEDEKLGIASRAAAKAAQSAEAPAG
jgi:hypothetical protein